MVTETIFRTTTLRGEARHIVDYAKARDLRVHTEDRIARNGMPTTRVTVWCSLREHGDLTDVRMELS